VNTQFGILALPTILLFHNSKPVSKFNHTNFNLENYAQFLATLTGIEPSGLLEVTETDMVKNLY
jgi:thioredoxin-like negative regulator of GroEL